MKEPPSPEEIESAAAELNVLSAFVEKDWYAIQLLRIIAKLNLPNTKIIFSGGTSLSKGYALIQRFSEDMDFLISPDSTPTRAERKDLLKGIGKSITSSKYFEISDDCIMPADGYNSCSFQINYTQQIKHPSLRPYLQLDLKYRITDIQCMNCQIRSIIDTLKQQQADLRMDCVTPIEIAADKFCAIIWRVMIKDRTQERGTK
jgi:hypothetical protein|tara:strand:+ start:86 stop:694 length:609 start_codon:yes stop_codon:yes gene_type:complete